MVNIIYPTQKELQDWLTHTVQHSSQVEYFLEVLGINSKDTQRPHDLVGEGNKFEWRVMRGLALHGRKGINFEEQILPSLERHRKQRHHRIWNGNGRRMTTPKAEIRLGAIDAICSRRENRGYQEQWSYEKIIEEAAKEKRQKDHWMGKVAKEMREAPQPKLERIANLSNIPNIGIPDKMYTTMIERVEEMKGRIKRTQGYDLE